MMAEVEYRGVNKYFGEDLHAIKDLSLKIEDGEFIVLVGPSGCGKSTALRLMAGLEQLSSGDVLIAGEVVNDLPPQERNIAMVFQNYALYPHKTVRKNLEFPLKMMKLDKDEIERRIRRASRLLGLGDYIDRRPGQLSGGQRQRVAMGRAIVRDPEVFLLDEPLSNLDAKLRVEIRAEIADLQREIGITTIYVTHDQVEAMTLGQRVAVLKDGAIQQVAPSQEIYQQPVNVFVAGFIGSPRMNIFHARLRKPEEGLMLEMGDTSLPVEMKDSDSAPDLEDHIDRPLLAGLRPEAFVPSGQVPENRRMEVKVAAAEALGHELIIYFDAPAGMYREIESSFNAESETDEEQEQNPPMAARLPSGPLPVKGDTLKIGVDTGQLHLFTGDGQAVAHL
jgi:multiple sugar transport system ATP-binding protein